MLKIDQLKRALAYEAAFPNQRDKKPPAIVGRTLAAEVEEARQLVASWPEEKCARVQLEGPPTLGVKGEPLVHIPKDSRAGKPPCGECHLQPGETCDICGAAAGVKGDE